MQIVKDQETEVHVQFWMDAPQRLRAISWGFLDNFKNKEYLNHPRISRLKRAFKVKETPVLNDSTNTDPR